jgi:transposase
VKEKVLAPTLKPGQTVVMDNLLAHKGPRVREMIERRGCELIYLPPYSPDLNLHRRSVRQVMGLLRSAGTRSCEALIEAMGKSLEAARANDARGFYEHRGYRLLAQPL